MSDECWMLLKFSRTACRILPWTKIADHSCIPSLACCTIQKISSATKRRPVITPKLAESSVRMRISAMQKVIHRSRMESSMAFMMDCRRLKISMR